MQSMGRNLTRPSSFDTPILGKLVCVCLCVRMGYVQWFVLPKASESLYLHNTSLSLNVESGLRIFFVVTSNNTDGPCEYIILSKSQVKLAGHS